jgi:hypothetical protein
VLQCTLSTCLGVRRLACLIYRLVRLGDVERSEKAGTWRGRLAESVCPSPAAESLGQTVEWRGASSAAPAGRTTNWSELVWLGRGCPNWPTALRGQPLARPSAFGIVSWCSPCFRFRSPPVTSLSRGPSNKRVPNARRVRKRICRNERGPGTSFGPVISCRSKHPSETRARRRRTPD